VLLTTGAWGAAEAQKLVEGIHLAERGDLEQAGAAGVPCGDQEDGEFADEHPGVLRGGGSGGGDSGAVSGWGTGGDQGTTG